MYKKSSFIHKLLKICNVVFTSNFDNNLVLSKVDIIENDKDFKGKRLTYENEVLYRRLDFTYKNTEKYNSDFYSLCLKKIKV